MFGISTSWKSEILDQGLKIIEAILELGVDKVELEYRLTSPMLAEILPLIREKRVGVLSLHHPFPLPEGVPRDKADGDVFSLSSLDQEERFAAVKWAKRTLEWAEKLEVQAVILHMGRVAMNDPMKILKNLFDKKKIATEEGREAIATQKAVRAQREGKYLDAALHSLEKLAKEAEKRNILLGLENRGNIQEIPDFQELSVFLEEFAGGPVFYWHDIGHATIQEKLGILPAGKWLESFHANLIGVHLHGCRGYDDHKAPGSGEEDYSLLKKFLRPEVLRIVETHHRSSPEELSRGLDFLRAEGII